MAVHYRFKSASKKWDTISFDSAVISVIDLKRAIVRKMKIDKTNLDFDLLITNAQTGERYMVDNFLIPKNTSVEVRRKPATPADVIRITQAPEIEITNADDPASGGSSGGPGAEQVGRTEEEQKLVDVLNQAPLYASKTSGAFSSDLAGRKPGISAVGRVAAVRGVPQQRGPQQARFASSLPSGYVCHRCRQTGHHIRNCPTNGDPTFDIRRPKAATGIPRSFLKTDPKSESGSLVLSDGTFAEMVPNERAFSEAIRLQTTTAKQGELQAQSKQRESITCPLCREVFNEPMVTPCCFCTYCNSCIRQALVVDEAFKCPSCGTSDISLEDLRPNRGIAKIVAEYNPSPATSQPTSPPAAAAAAAENLALANSEKPCAEAKPATEQTPPSQTSSRPPTPMQQQPAPLPPPQPQTLAASPQSSLQSTFCGRCGLEGHLSRDCPTVAPPPPPRPRRSRRPAPPPPYGFDPRQQPYCFPMVAHPAAAAAAPHPEFFGYYGGHPADFVDERSFVGQERPGFGMRSRARSRSPRRRRRGRRSRSPRRRSRR